MTELWVAVTAEYEGHTFSHRATEFSVQKGWEHMHFTQLLHEAESAVRAGLSNHFAVGRMPPDEKLSAIRRALQSCASDESQLASIRKVLDQ